MTAKTLSLLSFRIWETSETLMKERVYMAAHNRGDRLGRRLAMNRQQLRVDGLVDLQLGQVIIPAEASGRFPLSRPFLI